MTNPQRRNKMLLYNALFIIICVGLFIFLWNAPPETTARMPPDEIHAPFYKMERKTAEQKCDTCHNPEGVAPLPPEHPPTYRCLFCHKKEQLN
jgi:hypothetical protein